MALVLKPLANYKHSIVNSVSQCILICFSDSIDSTRLKCAACFKFAASSKSSLPLLLSPSPTRCGLLTLSLSLTFWQILYAICNSWAARTDSYHLFCAIEWEPDEAGPATEERAGQREGEAFDLLAITIFMAASQQQRRQLKTCGNQIGVVENWIYCQRSERTRKREIEESKEEAKWNSMYR